MSLFDDYQRYETRRQFFARGKNVLGYAALSSLLGPGLRLGGEETAAGRSALSHFAAKAKNIIYLHMVGGPAQMDLYDYKPVLKDWYDKDLPDSVRMGQRLTTMTSGQKRFSHRALQIQVQPGWPVRAVDEYRVVAVDRAVRR